MTKDEALKLALEALEDRSSLMKWQEARDAVKEALAQQCVCGEPNSAGTHRTDGPCLAPQPEHLEPVAWLHRQGNFTEACMNPLHDDEIARGWTEEPLYTTPPQRTAAEGEDTQRAWVGLTPQERDEINEQVYGAVPHHVAFHAAIEAKLKEKNT